MYIIGSCYKISVYLLKHRTFNRCRFYFFLQSVMPMFQMFLLFGKVLIWKPNEFVWMQLYLVLSQTVPLYFMMLRNSFRSLTNFMQIHSLVVVCLWWNVHRLTVYRCYWDWFGNDMTKCLFLYELFALLWMIFECYSLFFFQNHLTSFAFCLYTINVSVHLFYLSWFINQV